MLKQHDRARAARHIGCLEMTRAEFQTPSDYCMWDDMASFKPRESRRSAAACRQA